MVLSGYVSCEDKIIDCTRISSDRKSVTVPELNSKTEEADQRLIPHMHYSISQGAKRSIVISNSTGVFALLIRYLPDFLENELLVEAAERAEQCLIKVEQPKSTCVTFNELRFDMYRSRKTPYLKLPPSSHSLQGLLQRCFIIIRTAMNTLENQFEIGLLEFYWIEADRYIVPNRQLLPLPDFYLVSCGFTKKCTGRCSCAKQDVACTEFCKCKGKCSNLP